MPQNRSSDRSSRQSSSRSYKKSRRTAPVKQVITRIVKPLVEYESNDSSLSSNNSPVHFKEGRKSSSRSLSSHARVVVKTSKKSNKQTSSSRTVRETSRSRSSTSKITATSRNRPRKNSASSPRRSRKRKTTPRSKPRRRSSSSNESMEGRRVQHPFDYGPGSYPARSPNSYKSNFPAQVGSRDTWEQPPYDRLRSPPPNYPSRPQSPGYSHSSTRPANPVIRRSPSHSPHFHGSGSPRNSDYHESRRFLDRDGRQFAPRSPQQSPSYNHGRSHSPPNTGFVLF